MSERDDGRSNGDARGTSPGDDPSGDEPLGDLARRVRERRERGTDADGDDGDDGDSGRSEAGGADLEHGDRGDAFADREDLEAPRPDGREADGDVEALFEEMNVAEVDPDRVWESVLDEADDESLGDVDDPAATSDAGPGSGIEGPPDDADDGDEGHLVRKRAYCESCQYFTAPPEVACTYDGGEIVEVVDSERFRVRNCPVVAGRIDTDGVALGDGDVSVDDIE